MLSKVFLLLFCAQILSNSVIGSPRISSSSDHGRESSYENLIRRLDAGNYYMRNHLLGRNYGKVTVNELEDDFDYYMDQKAVQRAWSRSHLKRHQDYMNTHFVKLATENIKHVLDTAKCSVPTRSCLDVNKMGFGKPKTFWPNCALVHKCNHDSGCCKYPGHVCSPVETENIDLYFFSVEKNSEKQTGGVERLTFENHTRCDCRPMTEISLLPRNCHCPDEFFPVSVDHECRCDCDKKKSRVCRRIKRGKRSYHSKGCKGHCGHPMCDFGNFKSNLGRCPRKNDKGRRRR